MSKKQELIDYVKNMTPEQVEKVLKRLPELERIVKEEAAPNGI